MVYTETEVEAVAVAEMVLEVFFPHQVQEVVLVVLVVKVVLEEPVEDHRLEFYCPTVVR